MTKFCGQGHEVNPHPLIELLFLHLQDLHGSLAHLEDLALGEDLRDFKVLLSFGGNYNPSVRLVTSFRSIFSLTSFHLPGPKVFLIGIGIGIGIGIKILLDVVAHVLEDKAVHLEAGLFLSSRDHRPPSGILLPTSHPPGKYVTLGGKLLAN